MLPFSACRDTAPASSVSTDTARVSRVILERTEDLGSDYIDSFVFFGESTTYHLKSRGVLSGGTNTKQVLANESGTAILDSETENMKVIYPDTGELMSIGDAVAKKRPKYIFLCFGLNGAVANARRGEEYFKICYKELVDKIKTASPETKIIIGSCYPVAKNMDMTHYSVSLDELNEIIRTLNSWSLKVCEERDLRYLDTNEILTDKDGYLMPEYQVGDGHHLTREAYLKIIEYIRTHGYR